MKPKQYAPEDVGEYERRAVLVWLARLSRGRRVGIIAALRSRGLTVEDFQQEVILEVLQGPPKSELAMSTVIFRRIQWTLFKLLNKPRVTFEAAEGWEDNCTAAEDTVMVSREVRGQLEKAVSKLPPAQQDVIKHYHGILGCPETPTAEIAARRNVSITRICNLRVAAEERLVQLLKDAA